jgi:hypothetical protein
MTIPDRGLAISCIIIGSFALLLAIISLSLRGVAPSVQETQNSQFCFETRDEKVSCFATLSECEPAQRRAQEETRKCARSN